jgi:hypothetical protein
MCNSLRTGNDYVAKLKANLTSKGSCCAIATISLKAGFSSVCEVLLRVDLIGDLPMAMSVHKRGAR